MEYIENKTYRLEDVELLGVHSIFNNLSLGILDIIYDINDEILPCWINDGEVESLEYTQINYELNEYSEEFEPCFELFDNTYFLSEFLKVRD